MPIRVESTAGGTSYGDIRVGEVQVHQILLDVSAMVAVADADGYVPPGRGVTSAGVDAHTAGTAFAVVGPEPAYVGTDTGAADVFGNVIIAGALNGDMIADNTGAALAATLPSTIRLV